MSTSFLFPALILRISPFNTGPAVANTFVKVSIFLRKWMSMHAMRFIMPTVTSASKDVRLVIHRFKVKRIAAHCRSTKMVYLQSFWNLADEEFVADPMDFIISSKISGLSIDVSMPAAPGTNPEPTSRVWFDMYLSPEPLWK